jgi:predicted Zn-dependent peptidase
MSAEFNKTTLKNGLRIITVPKTDSPSATAMVLVGVGSRHEPENLAGISHFIEHNVFKGTKNRRRRNQVAEEIEGLGGETNAFTSHENTFYWAKVSAVQAAKILDVVMDISLNMTFPRKDLEIERGNVIEEINMYQDNPPARLLQDFAEFVWGGQLVGRRVLGTKKAIKNITQKQMLDFVRRNYSPKRMVVVAAGNIDSGKIDWQVAEFYGRDKTHSVSTNTVKFKEFQKSPRVYLDIDETKQTHFCLGFKSFDRYDNRRYALDLLNAILGEGMSSRLFCKIREEMGLAYYVDSSSWEFLDTGLWFARAGVDTKRADKAIKAILTEFIKLAEKKVGDRELKKAKEYIKGKTLLSVETSDELGGWYGFKELFGEEMISPTEYNRRVDAISAVDVKSVARDLLREDRLNLGVVGPFKDKERFEKILKL